MQIEKSYELPFPVETVYKAWVSSDTVIAPATAMDIDPRVGGNYRLIMETPEFSGRNEGKFLQVDPEEHVLYTWEWNGDGEITQIDVTFSASGIGTRVTIFHTGFQKQESVANHESGWDSYIAGFKNFLSPG